VKVERPFRFVSLYIFSIKDNSNGEIIPLVICECVTYLRENGEFVSVNASVPCSFFNFCLHPGLEIEGIFRRSANASVLKQVQQAFNDG
jgi:hypothetical protein